MVRLVPLLVPRAAQRAQTRAAVLVAALVLPGAVTAVLTHQANAGDLDARKARVQKLIEKADGHLDESSAELRQATRRLLAARADLISAREELSSTRTRLQEARALDQLMQQRLLLAEERLTRARAELALGRRDVVVQERELRRVIMASYEQGDPALMGLSMVFTTQDPAQLTGRLNANSTAANAASSALEEVTAARVLLKVRQQETRDAQQQVAARRQAAAQNLALQRELESAAQATKQRVAELVYELATARAGAARMKERDLRELRRLSAERERIEKLIRARASVGRRQTSSGRGLLDMPVQGYITSGYGWRTHPIWGYRSLHDGVDFGGGCGLPVRAAASGRVIAAYYQTAWGNRVIVDHGVRRGVGVATISNHLDSDTVVVGQRVRRGEVIGYTGNTGWSTACHLHWSVLTNGSPTDPQNWL